VSADEALRAGLVADLYEPDKLMDGALAIASELATQSSPLAVSVIRQHLWRGLTESHPMDSHRYESVLLAKMSVGPEAKEGINSFLEKRSPHFTSRIPDDLPSQWPLWEQPTF
jgi:enoyl-CoA hydratase/carnithine racemase